MRSNELASELFASQSKEWWRHTSGATCRVFSDLNNLCGSPYMLRPGPWNRNWNFGLQFQAFKFFGSVSGTFLSKIKTKNHCIVCKTRLLNKLCLWNRNPNSRLRPHHPKAFWLRIQPSAIAWTSGSTALAETRLEPICALPCLPPKANFISSKGRGSLLHCVLPNRKLAPGVVWSCRRQIFIISFTSCWRGLKPCKHTEPEKPMFRLLFHIWNFGK